MLQCKYNSVKKVQRYYEKSITVVKKYKVQVLLKCIKNAPYYLAAKVFGSFNRKAQIQFRLLCEISNPDKLPQQIITKKIRESKNKTDEDYIKAGEHTPLQLQKLYNIICGMGFSIFTQTAVVERDAYCPDTQVIEVAVDDYNTLDPWENGIQKQRLCTVCAKNTQGRTGYYDYDR